MVCPSRVSFSVVVVGLLILGLVVGIAVVLIDGLVIVRRMSVSVYGTSVATATATVTLTPTANSTAPPATTAAVEITYNFFLTVTVHNPNWFLDVHLASPLEASYSLNSAPFSPLVILAGKGEKLHAGDTKVYSLTTGVVGQTVPLAADGIADFARRRQFLQVDVVVAGNYTVRGARSSIAATCALKLPLGAPPASSEEVKCV